MKLIQNAKRAWTHYSTQALAAGVSLQAAWVTFPDDLKAALGPDAVSIVAKVTALILALGLIGKFIDQGGNGK